MYRISAVLTALIVLTVTLYSQTVSDPEAVNYFKDLRQKTLDRMPDRFTAEITGKTISDKLSSIPKDYVSNGKPYVEVGYGKDKGFQIQVRNVASYYTDLYRDYARFLNFGMNLSNQTTDSFISRYVVTFVSRDNSLIKLKMQIKGAEDANVLYVDRNLNRVLRVDTMRGNDIILSTIVSYTDIRSGDKTFSLINRMVTKRFKPSEAVEALEIKGFKVK